MTWPSGWRPAEKDEAERLARQLREELAPAHILYGRLFEVIARRDDSDDVLLRLDDDEIAEMHMTWAAQASETFPGVLLFLDFTDWQETQV
jgi:hypothetical protein